jgi:putative flippase GtrA
VNPLLHQKLFRYFLTAGAAALVDVGGFAVLEALGVPIAIAAVASFGVAAVVNYRLSSRHAFDAVPTWRGFGVFLLAALGGLLVNVSVTLLCTHYLGWQPVLAKIAGVGVAFLANFWMNLLVVFRTSASRQST